jgi:hypothetical protein
MANLAPGQQPSGDDVQGSSRESGTFSGTDEPGLDPTFEKGNYAGSLFGVQLPQGTSAPGTAGAAGPADPTNEPGQLTEGISGLGAADTADTGAPGTAGAENESPGGTTVKYTRPGSFLSGTNQMDTIRDDISGPNDWTQAIDGSYAGGGPDLPGLKGNQPTSTGAGGGSVLAGGYKKGAR